MTKMKYEKIHQHIENIRKAEDAKQISIAAVTRNNQDWAEIALSAVRTIAQSAQSTFSTDDVWRELERLNVPPPKNNKAMGGVMQKAMSERICVPTGKLVKSTRPECHRRPITEYRGCDA